jgi:hypothetical protein
MKVMFLKFLSFVVPILTEDFDHRDSMFVLAKVTCSRFNLLSGCRCYFTITIQAIDQELIAWIVMLLVLLRIKLPMMVNISIMDKQCHSIAVEISRNYF